MKKESHICIITQSHLSRNPRVLKEAIALARASYQVTILTTIISADLLLEDLALIEAYPRIKIIAVSDLSAKNFQSYKDRIVNKAARIAIQYFSIENYQALGYGAASYFKLAKSLNVSLYICHQELPTYTGMQLIRSGHTVAFDLEDWYSEDLLPEARKQRPVKLLKKIEAFALANGKYCCTTSQAMANKMSESYRTSIPAVVYNVFPSNESLLQQPKSFDNPLKLFWFSQTIGPGRGLEEFISLLKQITTPLALHLLGNIDQHYRSHLSAAMAGHHTIAFHPLVKEQELPEKISQFDIGLALERADPPSRNYTITNKFFQYIQSGLPVIASKTDGQSEAFEKYTPGIQIEQHPGEENINALQNWLKDQKSLQNAHQRTLEAAKHYNWEQESLHFLSLVSKALEQ